MVRKIIISIMVLILISITSVLGFTDCTNPASEVICDSSSIITNIAGSDFFCDDGSYWTNSSGKYSIMPLGTYTCFQDLNDVAQGSSETCCPSGSRCEVDSGDGDYGECVPAAEDYCWDYNTEDECNKDVSNVGIPSIDLKEGDNFCGQISKWEDQTDGTCFSMIWCGCEWDNTAEDGKKKCEGKWNNDSINCALADGGCTITKANEINNCDTDGELIIDWSSTGFGGYIGINPSPCIDEEKTYSCSIFELPFFTIFNFFVSIGILVVVYCFILKRVK